VGPGHFTRQIPPNASFHAVHVRGRCSDLQHGNRIHANVQPVQERSCHQHRYAFFYPRPREPLIQCVHSVCTVCTIILFLQIVQHAFRPKDRVYSRQHADSCIGSVQMQLDGSVTDGNGRLAGVRDSGTGTLNRPQMIRIAHD